MNKCKGRLIKLLGIIPVIIAMIIGIIFTDNKIIKLNNVKEDIEAMTTTLTTNFEKISAGFYHTMTLDPEGHLWVWGTNYDGQLGDGTTTRVLIPKVIMEDKTFTQIAGGASHSLAIDSDGKLWSWGKNLFGELGNGTTRKSITPIQIEPSKTFKYIAAGEGYSMAIDTNGDLWAWGFNEDGQLGDGTDEDKLSPVKIQLEGGTKFKKVSINSCHTLAIDENGKLWSWGKNLSGQLGDSTYTNSKKPIQIMSESNFIDISVGTNHSMAIDENGKLWTWGENDHGQLGNETETKSAVPVQIMFNLRFTKIATGGTHCVAIDIDKNLWTWGENTYGELGNGKTVDSSKPELIKEGILFDEITAGSFYTHAIDEKGNLWAFGKNENGWLGNGNTRNSSIPIQIKSGIVFKKIATNYISLHMLAIDSERNLWAWGDNGYGQLGNGTKNNIVTPIQIKRETKFKDAAVGRYASLAVDSKGNLWFWGHSDIDSLEPIQIMRGRTFNKVAIGNGFVAIDTDGNIWYGTTTELIQVTENIVFEQISGGNNHYLALDEEGNLWAWGNNFYGQFGNGTTSSSSSDKTTIPIKINSTIKFKEISAGYEASVGLDEDGNIYAWGNSQTVYGMSYTSANYKTKIPLKKNTDTTFKSISCGYNYVLAVSTDGQIYEWGYSNSSGQFGNGTTTASSTILQLEFGKKIDKVIAAGYSAYAIDNDGYLWSTGTNTQGYIYNGLGYNTYEWNKVTVSDGFTVTFVDPETGREDIQEVSNGDCAIPPDWKKEGYVVKWDQDFSRVTSNMTITASWELCKYKIEYDLRGGYRGTEAPTQGTYGVTINISNPARTGYTFTGWTSTVSDGLNTATAVRGTSSTTATTLWNGTLTKDTYFKNLNIADGKTVKLTANWSPNTYKITLDNRGATTQGTQEFYVTFGEKFSLTSGGDMISVIDPPTADGYVFGGYYLDVADFNNDEKYPYINSAGRITAATTMWAQDTTLYAKWIQNLETTYRVEYYKENKNLGSYQLVEAITPNPKGNIGQTVTAPTKIYVGYVENTTHPDRMISGEVLANGALTLKRYYDVIMCNVIFKEDGVILKEETVEYGKSANAPVKEKEGYVLTWDKSFNYVTSDIIVNLVWRPATYSIYKVEHYKQTSTGGYSLADIETLRGITDSTVEAKSKTTYLGYTENKTHSSRIASGTVRLDESLVLKLYYDITEYTVIFKDGEKIISEQQVGHGMAATEPTPLPTKQGYVLDWDKNFNCITGDMVVNAKWTVTGDTPYKIEHYKYNPETSEYEIAEIENKMSYVGRTVTATAKTTYLGYTENLSHPDRTSSGTVTADGSLVLKLYYSVKECKVIFKNGDEIIKQEMVGYGKAATEPNPAPIKQGYTLKWDKSFTNVRADMVVNAEWIANKNTPYTIRHYKESLETGQYLIHETETMYAETDTIVTAKAIRINGCRENRYNLNRIEKGTVAADGSLVLKLYYDLIEYTVTFVNEGTTLKQQAVKYGGDATLPNPLPTKENARLFWDKPYTNITKDTTINAIWATGDNVPYRVEHYLQDKETGEYEVFEYQNIIKKIGEIAIAMPKTYLDYTEDITYPNRVTRGTVTADGSLVLKLYYRANDFEVVFLDEEENSIGEVQTVNYGESAVAPILNKPGYTLTWDKSFDNVTKNLVVKAIWEPKADITYKVEHYLVNTDIEVPAYELEYTENLQGMINQEITANYREYTGFSPDYDNSLTVDKGIVKSDGTLKLKLYYKRNTYNINYILNGGIEIGKLPNSYTYGNNVIIPTNRVTKENCVFGGWYDNPNFTSEKITKIIDTDTGNKLLYAKWLDSNGEFYLRSNKYDIDDTKKQITKIKPTTTVNVFLSNMETNGTPKITNNNLELSAISNIQTGSMLEINHNGITYKYTNIVLGDIHANGEINIKDLVKLNQHILGKNTLNGIYSKAADVNGDGRVTIKDLVKLNQIILGKSSI